MTIEELEGKHYEIDVKSAIEDKVNPKFHTNLSIEFTISVLKSLLVPGGIYNQDIKFKIKELEQYLNEK